MDNNIQCNDFGCPTAEEEIKKIKQEIKINRRWDKIIVVLSILGILLNILKGIVID